MELPQLQYFRSVGKLQNLTKAARMHAITQPAISRSIARLEQELGVPLLERKGRHIRLNWLGEAFLQKADAALELLEEAARMIEELSGAEKGSIVIAESAPSPLAALSDSFRVRYPGVLLNVVRMPEEELRTRIRRGDIDFAISSVPPEGPGIKAATVFREEISLAVSQGHRFAGRETIALGELAEEPFVGYGYGHPFHELLESFCARAGFRMNIVCGLDDPAAICRTAAAGLGVAFVGECDADATGSLIRLRIEDQACSRTFRLVWHEGRYLSAAARLFRDELAAGFAASSAFGGGRAEAEVPL